MSKNRSFRYGKKCLSLCLAVSVACAVAPGFAAARPDAGTIKNSLEDQKIAEPEKKNVEIEVSNDKAAAPAPTQAAGPQIAVKGFHVTGQTIVSDTKVRELVNDAVGKTLSLTELEAVAQRIAGYLNKQGYLVANAYLPAQDVQDGIVEIAVVPGRYDNVDIRNTSRLSLKRISAMLSPIKQGDYVQKATLERVLGLLSDTSGVKVKGTLTPGKSLGTTTLIVEVSDGDDMNAVFGLDNYGNRYTGTGASTIILNMNNVSGQGDEIDLQNNYSGNGMNSNSITYTTLAGNRGGKIGVAYSNMHYILGKEFTAYGFTGNSNTVSLFGSYPLVRSRVANVNLQWGVDYHTISDNGMGIELDNKHNTVLSCGVNGNNRDKTGITSYALTLNAGDLAFEGGNDYYSSYPAADIDSSTARTAGRYQKYTADFARLQQLGDRLDFIFSFKGQLASKNLDSSEKLFIGGASGVRAYPQGEASGDEGYFARGEFRWTLPHKSLQVQLAAFVDTGHVTINKNPWAGAGENSRTLTGGGLGLIVAANKDYNIRIDRAWVMGGGHVTAEEHASGGRWLLSGVQYF